MLWGIASYSSDKEVIYFFMYAVHSMVAPVYIYEF